MGLLECACLFPRVLGLPLGGSRSGRILESPFLDLCVLVCFPGFRGLPLGGRILESLFLDLSPWFWGRLLDPSFLDLSVLACFQEFFSRMLPWLRKGTAARFLETDRGNSRSSLFRK